MSERIDGPTGLSVPEALVAMLDAVLLERVSGGAFRQVGSEPPPAWFSEALGSTAGAPLTLQEAFPVLDAFLSDAEIFWSRTAHGRLDGEAFVVAGPGGRDLPLATTAVALRGRQYLLIQHVASFDDRRQILQRAREQALAHEQVVRQIDALRPPVGRLARVAGELSTGAGLSDSQRAQLASMSAELDTIRTVLDGLPKPPPATSARRR